MELGIGDNDMDKTHILPWGTQIMREVDPLTDTVIIQFVKCSGGGIGQAHWEPGKCSVNHSVAQLCPTLRPHGLQHARPPCPLPTPEACSDSCSSNWWSHLTISSLVVPFSSCLQSFPASGPFPMSQFFSSGGQSTGVSASASVLPMNIQNWFPLRLTDLVSLQSTGLLVEINFAQLKFQQKVMTKVNEDFKRSWKFPWLLEIIMV